MRRRKKKRKVRRSSTARPSLNANGRTSQAEDPLLVFVSSLIDKMRDERDAVDRAIHSIPITRPWLFEHTPASSQEVEESYLSKVRECDLFVLLLGPDYSRAVAREYQTAKEAGKPVLAFVQRAERTPEQSEFVRSLATKYAQYSGPDDLHDAVMVAVLDEIIRRFKSAVPDVKIPELIQSLPVSARRMDEIAGYIIVGLEEADVGKILFAPFGGTTPPPNLEEAYPSFKGVFFESLDEMKEVFTGLNNAASKARKPSGDPQQAFVQALKDEAITIASRYVIRQRSQKPRPQVTVPGLSYFIWGLAPDVARMVQLMRPEEIHKEPTPVRRGSGEYLFKDVQYFLKVLTEIDRASRQHGGDDEEFLRLLIESAMRLTLLGNDGGDISSSES